MSPDLGGLEEICTSAWHLLRAPRRLQGGVSTPPILQERNTFNHYPERVLDLARGFRKNSTAPSNNLSLKDSRVNLSKSTRS